MTLIEMCVLAITFVVCGPLAFALILITIGAVILIIAKTLEYLSNKYYSVKKKIRIKLGKE